MLEGGRDKNLHRFMYRDHTCSPFALHPTGHVLPPSPILLGSRSGPHPLIPRRLFVLPRRLQMPLPLRLRSLPLRAPRLPLLSLFGGGGRPGPGTEYRHARGPNRLRPRPRSRPRPHVLVQIDPFRRRRRRVRPKTHLPRHELLRARVQMSRVPPVGILVVLPDPASTSAAPPTARTRTPFDVCLGVGMVIIGAGGRTRGALRFTISPLTRIGGPRVF